MVTASRKAQGACACIEGGVAAGGYVSVKRAYLAAVANAQFARAAKGGIAVIGIGRVGINAQVASCGIVCKRGIAVKPVAAIPTAAAAACGGKGCRAAKRAAFKQQYIGGNAEITPKRCACYAW